MASRQMFMQQQRRGFASLPEIARSAGAITGGNRGAISALLFGEKGVSMPPMSEPLANVGAHVSAEPTAAPATVAKKLPNGAVIAAEDTPGATASIGLYIEAGSVNETPHNSGAAHFMERLAFRGTTNRSALRVNREAEVTGTSLMAVASREQMAFCADTLKTHVPEAVELLLDSALNPKLEAWHVKENADAMAEELKVALANPQAMLMEAVHTTAYAGGLGRPAICPLDNLSNLTPEVLQDYLENNYVAPRMCLAAAGCSQEALETVAGPLLAALPAAPQVEAPKSVYKGGDFSSAANDPLTNMILCFEFEGGWRNQKAATALTVLQVLMGGGGSFSSGGPGKGMYSRLYTNVLNQHKFAHNCSAFQSLFNDTGLVGIFATADANEAGSMVDVMCDEMLSVANPANISSSELERAKKLTINSVLFNLESRAVAAEDIGRQVLTYGERKSPASFIQSVEEVTAADVAAVAGALMKSPLTMCSTGSLEAVPSYAQIASRF